MSTWIYEGIECYVASEQTDYHVPVYRAWNGGDHFYTTNYAEYNGLSPVYSKEGARFYIANQQLQGHVPLFRLYSGTRNDHFYCTSQSERQQAINNGYVDEPVVGYVIDGATTLVPEGHVPLFRVFHSGIIDHFYTTSAEEIQNIGSALVGGKAIGEMWLRTYGSEAGWKDLAQAALFGSAGAGWGTDGGYTLPHEIIPGPVSVPIPRITFRFDCRFSDHLALDRGKGRFRVRLYVQRGDGEIVVADQRMDLGTGDSSGNWSAFLEVSHLMEQEVESYRIEMRLRTRNTIAGADSGWLSSQVTVTLGEALGNFTLRYIPLAIVYCPPGQDMTNSLSLTESFGTQVTVGNSSAIVARDNFRVGFSYKGIVSSQVGQQESQSSSNSATSGHRISYFRNTVVTADNQRAIGRAYWGPLGDLFVVMVNAKYSAWGSLAQIQYEHTDCDQILIIPAHRLLRPGNDVAAQSMPAEERRKLLELDPFINKWALDSFFPDDQGMDLKLAANSYADPTVGGRADPIGIWHLGTGTELNYSIGEEIKLNSTRGSEVSWSTGISGDFQIIAGFGGGTSTTIGIQQTSELEFGSSRSASCFLIRNQNSVEQEAIKVYFDKNFGTLMFRKIRIEPTLLPPDMEVPETQLELPDVPMAAWILELILEVAQTLGLGDLALPQEPIILTEPDLGIPKLFPDIPPESLPELLSKLRSVLSPDKSLMGTVYDRAMMPVFNETIELSKGNTTLYATETDAAGQFRFDNILPGKYVVKIGDRSLRVTLGINRTYSNPREINIRNVRRMIDPANTPRWKLRELLGASSERIDRIVPRLNEVSTVHQLGNIVRLSDDQRQLLRRRIHIPPRGP